MWQIDEDGNAYSEDGNFIFHKATAQKSFLGQHFYIVFKSTVKSGIGTHEYLTIVDNEYKAKNFIRQYVDKLNSEANEQ